MFFWLWPYAEVLTIEVFSQKAVRANKRLLKHEIKLADVEMDKRQDIINL